MKYYRACLGDSARFIAVVPSCYYMTASALDIFKYFQSDTRNDSDRARMRLSPHCKEWFDLRHPYLHVPDNATLVLQLFNVCQGVVSAGKLWDDHFEHVLDQIGTTKSLRDSAIFTSFFKG